MLEHEATIRLDIQHAVRAIGLWDYHPPDDSPAVTNDQIRKLLAILKQDAGVWFSRVREFFVPPGWKRDGTTFKRPDIYGLNPTGPTPVIECKWIETKVNVMPWFDPAKITDGQRDWLDSWVYIGGGQAFLGIGTVGVGRRLFVIPWERWIEMEQMLGEKNLNFHITLLDLEWCGSEFELDLPQGSKLWKFRGGHPLFAVCNESSSPNQINWKNVVPHSFRFAPKKEAHAD